MKLSHALLVVVLLPNSTQAALTCTWIGASAGTNGWCNSNCNAVTPFCPSASCSCTGGLTRSPTNAPTNAPTSTPSSVPTAAPTSSSPTSTSPTPQASPPEESLKDPLTPTTQPTTQPTTVVASTYTYAAAAAISTAVAVSLGSSIAVASVANSGGGGLAVLTQAQGIAIFGQMPSLKGTQMGQMADKMRWTTLQVEPPWGGSSMRRSGGKDHSLLGKDDDTEKFFDGFLFLLTLMLGLVLLHMVVACNVGDAMPVLLHFPNLEVILLQATFGAICIATAMALLSEQEWQIYVGLTILVLIPLPMLCFMGAVIFLDLGFAVEGRDMVWYANDSLSAATAIILDHPIVPPDSIESKHEQEPLSPRQGDQGVTLAIPIKTDSISSEPKAFGFLERILQAKGSWGSGKLIEEAYRELVDVTGAAQQWVEATRYENDVDLYRLLVTTVEFESLEQICYAEFDCDDFVARSRVLKKSLAHLLDVAVEQAADQTSIKQLTELLARAKASCKETHAAMGTWKCWDPWFFDFVPTFRWWLLFCNLRLLAVALTIGLMQHEPKLCAMLILALDSSQFFLLLFLDPFASRLLWQAELCVWTLVLFRTSMAVAHAYGALEDHAELLMGHSTLAIIFLTVCVQTTKVAHSILGRHHHNNTTLFELDTSSWTTRHKTNDDSKQQACSKLHADDAFANDAIVNRVQNSRFWSSLSTGSKASDTVPEFKRAANPAYIELEERSTASMDSDSALEKVHTERAVFKATKKDVICDPTNQDARSHSGRVNTPRAKGQKRVSKVCTTARGQQREDEFDIEKQEAINRVNNAKFFCELSNQKCDHEDTLAQLKEGAKKDTKESAGTLKDVFRGRAEKRKNALEARSASLKQSVLPSLSTRNRSQAPRESSSNTISERLSKLQQSANVTDREWDTIKDRHSRERAELRNQAVPIPKASVPDVLATPQMQNTPLSPRGPGYSSNGAQREPQKNKRSSDEIVLRI